MTNEAFGIEALDKAAQEKGFGKPSREAELKKRREEMLARHAKADKESAERDAAWKAKYGSKLKEAFFGMGKPKPKINRPITTTSKDAMVVDKRTDSQMADDIRKKELAKKLANNSKSSVDRGENKRSGNDWTFS